VTFLIGFAVSLIVGAIVVFTGGAEGRLFSLACFSGLVIVCLALVATTLYQIEIDDVGITYTNAFHSHKHIAWNDISRINGHSSAVGVTICDDKNNIAIDLNSQTEAYSDALLELCGHRPDLFWKSPETREFRASNSWLAILIMFVAIPTTLFLPVAFLVRPDQWNTTWGLVLAVSLLLGGWSVPLAQWLKQPRALEVSQSDIKVQYRNETMSLSRSLIEHTQLHEERSDGNSILTIQLLVSGGRKLDVRNEFAEGDIVLGAVIVWATQHRTRT
jgi:hypothetical protein